MLMLRLMLKIDHILEICLENKICWQSRQFSSLKVVNFEVRSAFGNVSLRKLVDWESATGTKEWKFGRFVTSAMEHTANAFFCISYIVIVLVYPAFIILKWRFHFCPLTPTKI